MRSFFLASAAIILSAGMAGAQTASPAPTGAPNAPTVTSPGMSPGNTAPAPNPASGTPPVDTGTPTASPMTDSGSSGSMAPPAAGSAAPPAPDMSPSAATNTAPPEKMKPSMSMSHITGTGHMALPADADAGTYLKMAKSAIKHHSKALADDALSHAETRLLDRAVPAGGIAPDSSPAIASIDNARKALAAGDMKAAAAATDTAISQSMAPAQ